MRISKLEKEWLTKTKNKNELLGQVFTPEEVSDLMVTIALKSNPDKILEPCFGEGAFLDSINNKAKNKNYKVLGVEIDPELYIKVKNNLAHVNTDLYNMDFFDFEEKVDCIIMNPPYIRQELLSKTMPKFLNKQKICDRLPKVTNKISPRSNLYTYFFLKSWDLLNQDGEIVAIIPNTWMSTEYGSSFKKFLLDNFSIELIIQFNKDVFPNADVDSCIIHLIKKPQYTNNASSLITINQGLSNSEIENFKDFLKSESEKFTKKEVSNIQLQKEKNWLNLFNEKTFFDFNSNMISLDQVTNLKRGITTNYNDFFITAFNSDVEEFPNYFKEIICSPKDIQGYSTKSLRKKYFLFNTLESKKDLPLELKKYVEKHEEEIICRKKPETIYRKIKSNSNTWFNIKRTYSSPILFSYIVRDRKKFILNDSQLVARDNFYEITPNENINLLVLFAILNSRITSLLLEDLGRSHGKGLLKIQKYELEKLLVPDPNKIKFKDVNRLEELSIQLISSLEKDAHIFISEIDEILLPYISKDMNTEQLAQMLNKKLESRLEKRTGYLQLLNK